MRWSAEAGIDALNPVHWTYPTRKPQATGPGIKEIKFIITHCIAEPRLSELYGGGHRIRSDNGEIDEANQNLLSMAYQLGDN